MPLGQFLVLLLIVSLCCATAPGPWRLYASSSTNDYLIDVSGDINETTIWAQPYARDISAPSTNETNVTSPPVTVVIPSLERIYRSPADFGGALIITSQRDTYIAQPDRTNTSHYKVVEMGRYDHTFQSIDLAAFAPNPKCDTLDPPQEFEDWPTEYLAGKHAAETMLPGYVARDMDDGYVMYDTASDSVRILAMDVFPGRSEMPRLCMLLSNVTLVCVNATGPEISPEIHSLANVLPADASPSSFAWSCRLLDGATPMIGLTDWNNNKIYFVEFINATTMALVYSTPDGAINGPTRLTAYPNVSDRFLVKSDEDPYALYDVTVPTVVHIARQQPTTSITMRLTETATGTIVFQNVAEAISTGRAELLASAVPTETPSTRVDGPGAKPSDESLRTVFVVGACFFFICGAAAVAVVLAYRIRKANARAKQNAGASAPLHFNPDAHPTVTSSNHSHSSSFAIYDDTSKDAAPGAGFHPYFVTPAHLKRPSPAAVSPGASQCGPLAGEGGRPLPPPLPLGRLPSGLVRGLEFNQPTEETEDLNSGNSSTRSQGLSPEAREIMRLTGGDPVNYGDRKPVEVHMRPVPDSSSTEYKDMSPRSGVFRKIGSSVKGAFSRITSPRGASGLRRATSAKEVDAGTV